VTLGSEALCHPKEKSTSSRQLHEALCFYLQRGTSEHSPTSHRLFLPICLMYYYSLQIKIVFKNKKKLQRNCCLRCVESTLLLDEVGAWKSVASITFHRMYGADGCCSTAITTLGVIFQSSIKNACKYKEVSGNAVRESADNNTFFFQVELLIN
jgi:hypothetical protein